MKKPSDIALMALLSAPEPPPEVFVDHPVTNWCQGWGAACHFIFDELRKLEKENTDGDS